MNQMTNFSSAVPEFAQRPSKSFLGPISVRLQTLMEEAQKLEIGQRIKELREQSRFTQPELAELLGIGLRAYQKLEAEGTTKWERAEELARIHGVDVYWLWHGRETTSPPAPLNGAQLERIERKLDQLLELAETQRAVQAAAVADQVSGRSDRRSAPARASRRKRAAGG